jgi:hypothetical protein
MDAERQSGRAATEATPSPPAPGRLEIVDWRLLIDDWRKFAQAAKTFMDSGRE